MLEATEIQCPSDRELCQVVAVGRLLTCETVTLQLRQREAGDALGRDPPKAALQPGVGGTRRGQGHLLFEDDPNERGEPGPAVPQRGRTEPSYSRGEVFITRAEFTDGMKQDVSREPLGTM